MNITLEQDRNLARKQISQKVRESGLTFAKWLESEQLKFLRSQRGKLHIFRNGTCGHLEMMLRTCTNAEFCKLIKQVLQEPVK